MSAPRKRLTVRGGGALEAELEALLARIAKVARAEIPRPLLRSLVLIGGYGRGEGGVDRGSGRERPHNNLDLLLVVRHMPVFAGTIAKSLGRELDRALAPISREVGVGIDVGAITDERLASARCLVMWSDMRQGHRVVAGDPTFVASLSRFEPSRVEVDDVLALLVNRATLLLVNRALLRAAPTAEGRRVVVRHAMKAIVGAGDALLFTRGLYDGSYLEKQRRLAALGDAPEALVRWYDRAIAFRLEPDYASGPSSWDPAALTAWNAELLGLVEGVHRRFETERLGRPVVPTWDGYLEAAVARAHGEGARSLRDRLRAARDASELASLPTRARVGWREVLPLLFPLVAYRASTDLAGRLLGAGSTGEPELDRAYLRAWGRHGDPAFERVAQGLGLDLGGGADDLSDRRHPPPVPRDGEPATLPGDRGLDLAAVPGSPR